jgi:hypothetical protein
MRVPRPSTAVAIASAALFVSLGGSSYAGIRLARDSVLSRNIKDGQVKRPDLARDAVGSAQVQNGSLLATDFKSGQLPAGPVGPQGPKGDPAHLAPAVRAATTRTTATQQAPGVAVTAKCNPGEVATGGGGHTFHGVLIGTAPTDNPEALFTDNDVTGQGYRPTAWSAAAVGDPGEELDVTAWVVCTPL